MRPSKIKLFWGLSAGIVAVAVIIGLFWRPGLLPALLAVPCACIAMVITMTSHRLSPQGDRIQAQIHELLMSEVGSTGSLLDIGCGSGELIIKVAKNGTGSFAGLDYWPDKWAQFGQSQAQSNAMIEGVPDIEFVHGSASELPFTMQSSIVLYQA